MSNRDSLDKVGQTFSVKDQIVNILGFADHKVSVAATQLCLVVGKQSQPIPKSMPQLCASTT